MQLHRCHNCEQRIHSRLISSPEREAVPVYRTIQMSIRSTVISSGYPSTLLQFAQVREEYRHWQVRRPESLIQVSISVTLILASRPGHRRFHSSALLHRVIGDEPMRRASNMQMSDD